MVAARWGRIRPAASVCLVGPLKAAASRRCRRDALPARHRCGATAGRACRRRPARPSIRVTGSTPRPAEPIQTSSAVSSSARRPAGSPRDRQCELEHRVARRTGQYRATVGRRHQAIRRRRRTRCSTIPRSASPSRTSIASAAPASRGLLPQQHVREQRDRLDVAARPADVLAQLTARPASSSLGRRRGITAREYATPSGRHRRETGDCAPTPRRESPAGRRAARRRGRARRDAR